MTYRRTFDRRLAVLGGLAASFDSTDNGSSCANVGQAQLMIMQVGGVFLIRSPRCDERAFHP